MLRDMGVQLPASPGQSAYFRLYERFGEDPITMRIARHASRLFKGAAVTTVQAAGKMAADVLASDLLPAATTELARHREAGTTLLLATTSPRELAQPFAEAAGFDDVLCTVYRSVDGVYDGANDGAYVWGDQKAEAVAVWAGEQAVDLTESSAYSDSWYDVPLLELVGNPVAVNADLRLFAFARSQSWDRRRWLPEDEPGASADSGKSEDPDNG